MSNEKLDLENENPKNKSRLKNIINAVFNGFSVGSIFALASIANSENKNISIGLGSYLISKKILRRFLKEKPLWIEVAVESGIAISLLMILNNSLENVWLVFLNSYEKMLQHLQYPPELSIPIIEILNKNTESGIYIVFFLLLTQRTIGRGLIEFVNLIKNLRQSVDSGKQIGSNTLH